MATLFRKLRRELLEQQRFSKYLIYAVGEIVLVVIGILIALQVNNSNQKRIEAENIASYYSKLSEEVDGQRRLTEQLIVATKDLLGKQRKSLSILAANDLSQAGALTQNIGSFPTCWVKKFYMPIFQEFQNQNLLAKVDNPKLKQLLLSLEDALIDLETGDHYLEAQYNSLIEPYFAKHINYTQVAMPRYVDGLVSGGPSTDVEALFASMEFWNIATLKLETTNSELQELEEYLSLLKQLHQALPT